MKKITLLFFTLLGAVGSFAQGMFGGSIGIGSTTSYKSYFTPSFEGCYLARMSRHIYIGGALDIQRYSFYYALDKGPYPSYGDILSIRQKSTYIFFSPKFDLGIGHRNYVHFNFSIGPGIFMGGNKYASDYEPLVNSGGSYSGGDTVTHTITYNMRTIILRSTVGVTERIPTHGYWSVTLSQEVSILPGKLNYPGIDLRTNYFQFSVGLMHKYPMVTREE